MSNLKTFYVLYREQGELLIDPWGYSIQAESFQDAEELFEAGDNSHREILWVVETDNYDDALEDYYSQWDCSK